jgi:arylformamidase
MFSHMALGLNMRGIAVAVAGYDLCPQISIAGIIDEMRNACLYLWRRYGKRLFIYGHSAGGHVAAALMATDWKAIDLQAPVDLVPAACAISGLFDLTPLVEISGNADFRLDAASARAVSPLFWAAPRGATLDVVVGGAESAEFLRQSRSIAESWGKAGVVTRYDAVAGMNHFTVIDALTIPDSPMVDRLAALAIHASKSS